MEATAARGLKRKPRDKGAAGPSTQAPPSRMSQYVYLQIVDALKAPGSGACIFAVILEIGASVRSRGTDFTLTLRIADESRPAGISVTFFAQDIELLPCVRSSGDVISLHNVTIQMYCGEFFVVFNKRFSSFALFEGKVSTESRPYQTSMRYIASINDTEILTQMRKFLLDHPPGPKDMEFQLRSIQSDSDFDLVCKVLHVCEAPSGQWVFYVWDGTDTPATDFQISSDAEAITSAPLHPEEVPLPREVLCRMPCIGTVLRVFSNMFVKEIRHLQNNIYWARLCNISCKQEFGMWKSSLLASSKIRLLSNEDGRVIERLEMYDSRVQSQVHRQPMASIQKVSDVTDVHSKKAGYITLMESLTHGQVTHKFKTLVRVVGACSSGGRDLNLLLTGKNCLRLTLEDPTARIHASVHKTELIWFFGGFLTKETLTKKMNMLLGVSESEETGQGNPLTRSPPWIWCCLKSYHRDKLDTWGSRQYSIFGTKVRD